MTNLNLITFDENGQGVVDWESLEALTSVEFVEEVKSLFVDSDLFSVTKFEIDVSTYFVTVFIKTTRKGSHKSSLVSFYQFNRKSNEFNKAKLNKFEVQNLVTILGGVVNWQKS